MQGHRLLSAALAVVTLLPIAPELGAEPPRLGQPLSSTELETYDTLVFADGQGLPAGRGDVAAGATLYLQQCLVCHGERGRGASADALADGRPDLTLDPPDQTIGTYWPYATTLFDFIRRAMPLHAPGSLSNDQVYAVTAYLLFENGILDEDAVLDRESLLQIEMPNRDGFIWIDAAP